MSVEPRPVYEFGPFRLEAGTRRLLRDGEAVPVTAKVLDTLLVLVEHAGELVTKEQLMQSIWPETAVEEGNLTQNVHTLRKIFGEHPDEHRYIVTAPGRGYRFVAPLREAGPESELLVGQLTRSRVVIEDELAIEHDGVGIERQVPARRWSASARLLSTSALVALAAVLVYVLASDGSLRRPRAPVVRSIAVLPFQPLDANEQDSAFGLKLTDALIGRLGRLRQLAVRSTRAVQGYQSRKIDPLAAGREQQVDAVLDGSFQRAGERLLVRARLLRTRDGGQLWEGTFDERDADPFALQDAIAEQAAQALLPELSGAERRLVARHDTESAAASRLYSEARYLWNRRDAAGLRRSVQLLEQALAFDPNYARAYAGLADSYITLSDYELSAPNDTFPRARESALRALRIDDSLAEAHTALAMIKAEYDWDFAGADRAFARAIELDPHYATAHQWYAELLSGLGRHEQALAEIRLAQQLDPLSLIIPTIEALVLNFARDYDGAVVQCRRVIARDPDFAEVYVYLLHAYAQKGMYGEAMDAYRKWSSLMGYGPGPATASADPPVHGARDYWQRMAALATPPTGSILDRAQALARLGDTEGALAALERAYGERSYGMIYLGVNANFDALRADPRFEELLRRIGLPQAGERAASTARASR